jgi:hypothetical protein
MIEQIKSDGKCSGDFDDAKWPRNERLVFGQRHLETEGLPSLANFQKQCRASALAAPSTNMPVDPLWAFLNKWTVQEQLKPEAIRRGLSLIDPETGKARLKKSYVACIHRHILETKDYPQGFSPEVQPPVE